MSEPVIYRCPVQCPIKKSCFIIKVEAPIKEPIPVLKKCEAQNGKDIRIRIGGDRPP